MHKVQPSRCIKHISNSELKKLHALDKNALEMLLHIRSTKETILRKTLGEILTKQTIKKLNQLEHELGLIYPYPISSTIALPELAFRLGSIESLISSKVPTEVGS